jgi:hypothetical protein
LILSGAFHPDSKVGLGAVERIKGYPVLLDIGSKEE